MKEKILSKVKNVGDCWIWTGAKKGSGLKSYGHLTVGSRTDGTRKTVSAHRFCYETYFGPIPNGMFVCHKCDTPSCVNPEHLFLGTRQDNVDDRENKGRNSIPALSGEDHPFSLLTWDIVMQVRSLVVRKGEITALAKKYGVDRKTMSDVINGKTWKNPPPPAQEQSK